MWEFIKQYDAEFVSVCLTAILVFIGWVFQPRVKLVWGVAHGFAHAVPNRPVLAAEDGKQRLDDKKAADRVDATGVYTMSHIISNLGRKPATDVEVTFNFKPDSFELWNPRQYEEGTNPAGKFIVKFDSLAPKEQFSMNLLMVNSETPSLLSVRCRETTGKQIPLVSQRQYSRLTQVALLVALLLGAGTGIYLLIKLVAWFALLGASGGA